MCSGFRAKKYIGVVLLILLVLFSGCSEKKLIRPSPQPSIIKPLEERRKDEKPSPPIVIAPLTPVPNIPEKPPCRLCSPCDKNCSKAVVR